MKTIEIDGVTYQCYDRMNRKIRSAIAKIQMKYRAPEKVNELKYTHPKREFEESDVQYNDRIAKLIAESNLLCAVADGIMRMKGPEDEKSKRIAEIRLDNPKGIESDAEYNERIDELFRMNPEMVDFMDEMLCKGYQLIVFAPKMTTDQLMEMDPDISDKILTEIVLGHLLKLMDKTSDERVKELTKKADSVSS